mmetsp:Transcript_5478/g.8783  ORF Transcript_5478/g.8783 Transcript_5478/m.8783 type:complete len:282 (-) Transcript_5478:47-892(-)
MLFLTYTFPAHGAISWSSNPCSLPPPLSEVLDVEDAHGAQRDQPLGLGVPHFPLEGDFRKQAVGGRCHWGVLGVVLARPLPAVGLQGDLLPGAQLGQQDVPVHGPNVRQALPLGALRHPLQRAGRDGQRGRPRAGPPLAVEPGLVRGALRPLVLDVQAEDQGVGVRGLVPRGESLELGRVRLDRHQPDPMGKDFIVQDGGVNPDVNVFDRHGGNLSQKNSPQCICDRNVYSDQIENHFFVRHGLNLNFQGIFELFHIIPSSILFRTKNLMGRIIFQAILLH